MYWVTISDNLIDYHMPAGCNDGENFSESFLLDIYDRIQSVSNKIK